MVNKNLNISEKSFDPVFLHNLALMSHLGPKSPATNFFQKSIHFIDRHIASRIESPFYAVCLAISTVFHAAIEALEETYKSLICLDPISLNKPIKILLAAAVNLVALYILGFVGFFSPSLSAVLSNQIITGVQVEKKRITIRNHPIAAHFYAPVKATSISLRQITHLVLHLLPRAWNNSPKSTCKASISTLVRAGKATLHILPSFIFPSLVLRMPRSQGS
ncbi:MAG: hypothetical protein Tsb0021_08530 [Chlamydiales bacterium]